MSARNYKYFSYMLYLLLIIGSWLCLNSCSVESRHKVLTTVFDGVPPPVESQTVQSGLPDPSQVDHPGKSTGVQPAKIQWSLHEPFSQKECGSCHDSGRSNRLILPADQLCLECHDNVNGRPWTHGPVSGGGCSVCHEPHKAPQPNLLKHEGNELCISCHIREKGFFAGSSEHRTVDQAVCSDCHYAHSGDDRFMLKDGARVRQSIAWMRVK